MRRWFALVRGLLLAGACALSSAGALWAQDNNVLILVADDVGVEKIGAYGVGAAPPLTPNIDALAAGGVLFRNATVNPLCSPTRACLMTGRYSFRTGVGAAQLQQGGVVRLEETTIPELLDANGAGYAHAAIGKWHVGDERNGGLLGPNKAGWSHFAGFMTGVGDYYNWPRVVNGVESYSQVYNTTATVDDALAWIRSAPEPWVCYVAFQAAHTPWQVPPFHLFTYQLPPELTALQRFRAIVEAMDTEMGRLLTELGAARARTDVIFLGDNGTPPGALEPPYRAGQAKGTPYQGGVHVPLIVSGPSVVAPGREVDALVGAVDVFSTVVDLCGVEPELPWVQLDGVSMVPYLRDAAQPPLRTHVLTEIFQGASPPAPPAWLAYRDARYKLLGFAGAGEEFYDLEVDPYESNDLLLGPMTPAESAAYLALRDGVDRLRNPSAALSRYGSTGCQGSNGWPAIGASGTAVMGESYTVSLTGAAPGQPAALVLGSSRRRWSGGALPFPFATVGGAPGCFLHASDDYWFATVSDRAGRAWITFPVPFDPVLLAGSFFHSWVASDPQAPENPIGLIASDGLQTVLGWPTL